MAILITSVHVLACFVLIVVVLLQAGKGANMGAAFGGSSQTVFGTTGAGTFLGKMTTVVAVVFMITSLGLSHPALQQNKTRSLLDGASRPGVERRLPVVPAPQSTLPPAAPTQKAPVPTPVK
ncbi:MAG: preprotein translocase subunit SecG [Smithellaceae bacterium]|nr:preprotein translocase subunit SecG [Smithellaceae bacterium]